VDGRWTVEPYPSLPVQLYGCTRTTVRCAPLWSSAWAPVRQRAAQVLEHHLKDQEDAAALTMLEVEVEVDECDDDLLANWECDMD
jgi:hypothetical protein